MFPHIAWQARPENRSQPSTIFNHNRWIAKIKTVLKNSIVEWSFYLLASCWWERRICGRQYLCVCCFLSQSISQTKESTEKTHFQGSCPFTHTGDFGGELRIRCSFGSGSGLCEVSESDGSVLGEFSSLCLLSSNNNRLRSSCVHKCIIVNQKTQITRSNTAVFAKDSLIYALKIKQQSEHKRSPPHLRHALQTSTHLLAGFLAHHVRAEWVSVIRRPCLTLHVPGDYKVSASVFPRQVTHPLSEQLLSLRLGFPQLLLDLHDIQQGRAVRGLKFIRNQNNRRWRYGVCNTEIQLVINSIEVLLRRNKHATEKKIHRP